MPSVRRQFETRLNRLMVGRTTVVIAHRLSTIRHADAILVLDHGEIVEQGSHDQLLARGGLYSQLVSAQMTFRSSSNITGQASSA